MPLCGTKVPLMLQRVTFSAVFFTKSVSRLPEIECRETQYTPQNFISLHQMYDENTRIRLIQVNTKEVQAVKEER